jgi:hypothetical protein
VVAAAGVLAVCALLALAAAPLGARAGWWDFRVGFRLLAWAVYLAGGAGLLALVGGLLARRIRGALIATALAAAVAAVPLLWMRQARAVPAIHDVTTDTTDPPAFVAILPLRKGAPNPPEYAGAETARQQRAAYPDLRPLVLTVPPRRAFEAAVAAARDEGWEIVAQDLGFGALGRIEAVDTTFWFRFKDDIVVRVVPHEAGSRVDVRSKSRVGRSDVGTNARRIRDYLALVAEKAREP